MVSKDTTKPGELKEEVVKARKEEGQDYFDDYEREKKVFEKDSDDSESFGIDKFDVKVIESKSESNELEEDSYEHKEDSNEFDSDSNDSEYFDDNSNESGFYYDSNESHVSVKDSKKSKISEDGQDYNDGNNVKDDTKSSRKTFYQSHIYPMHLLENLKVCLFLFVFSF